MPSEGFDEVLAVHLRGAWAASRSAARAMRAGGSIVNVVSGSALYGLVGQCSYAAAKGGMLALARGDPASARSRAPAPPPLCPDKISPYSPLRQFCGPLSVTWHRKMAREARDPARQARQPDMGRRTRDLRVADPGAPAAPSAPAWPRLCPAPSPCLTRDCAVRTTTSSEPRRGFHHSAAQLRAPSTSIRAALGSRSGRSSPALSASCSSLRQVSPY